MQPPAGFFVDPAAPRAPPPAPTPARATQTDSSSSSATPGTPSSLIKRLQLESRLSELPPSAAAKGKGKAVDAGAEDSSSGAPATPTPKGKGRVQGAAWEASPELREKSLKERKAKMVLEARRLVPPSTHVVRGLRSEVLIEGRLCGDGFAGGCRRRSSSGRRTRWRTTQCIHEDK